MPKHKISKFLTNVDNAITNIASIAEDVVDKVRNPKGGWGLEALISTPIADYCLTDMGDWQLRKHMLLSLTEKWITLDMFADSVSGISNKISDEVYNYYYSYNKGNNYIEEYQHDAKKTSTRKHNTVDGITHRGNYGEDVNLYYDENNTGIGTKFEQKRITDYAENRNRNSILRKTKELFNCKKINTIISSFHTDPSRKELYDGTDVKTEYGLSHGRNLLTYDAEHNGVSYDRNGYDNPYCRVWTHHHQYNEYRSRLMRPFASEDGHQSNSSFHVWDNFSGDNGISKGNEWGWKSETNNGWKYSVLDRETGLLNITPKYSGGAEKNVHTKDCMFSIENLAWQGYDPYSFEKALSWEQRGPFGGRIMWFPPYGLRFSEETSARWDEHSFIGRGENVFTYTNTTRTGTLEFMMVVDHPSILDYSTWYGGKYGHDELPKDTDIYRFFAGCDGCSGVDSRNGNKGLSSYAKPTPMTDEYLKEDNVNEEKVEEKKEEPQTDNQPSSDEEITLTFYVFFPNNYSGYYDYNTNSNVNPIAYLLYGNGAQWKCNDDNVELSSTLPIEFNTISYDGSSYGVGYEMLSYDSKDELDRDKNYIWGTIPWNEYKGSTKYIKGQHKWYYRIDGEYKVPNADERNKNTFDQQLIYENNYFNTYSYGLNYKVDTVTGTFTEEAENENIYTLAEIAYALSKNSDVKDKIEANCTGLDEKRISKLVELLDTSDESMYRVTEISGVGFSNSHANNASKEVNKERNDFLAEERCNTVIRWFKDNYGASISSTPKPYQASVEVSPKDKQDASGITAKKYRSAKMTLKIQKTKVMNPKDLNTAPLVEEAAGQMLNGENEEIEIKDSYSDIIDLQLEGTTNDGTKLYSNPNETDKTKTGQRWTYDKDGNPYVFNDSTITRRHANTGSNTSGFADNIKDVNNEVNNLRYDQEYHFFKKLSEKDPHVFKKLVDKLQYFDPAFHSMTPEGFMGRLTFLHQCTRQGDTVTASDSSNNSESHGYTANNLAFGRPPFCILRLGDFYYQKIVINNISINYDPLVLDLNNEGVGVVPLIANVTISFNFIGGGDLSGPVRRLQNAMSFSYYANSRLYDNRADRVERESTQWDTMGAMGNDKINFDDTYTHQVQMAK